MSATAIGRPLPRVEAIAKVTGAARYSAEFDQPGQAHAVLVTSIVGLGRVAKIDAAVVLQEREPGQTRITVFVVSEPGATVTLERLRALVQRSKALQRAVRRLDATIHAAPARADRGNPVERQIGLLKAAFERE